LKRRGIFIRTGYRRGIILKWIIQIRIGEGLLNYFGSGQGPKAGCCENGNYMVVTQYSWNFMSN
jgi:hypothetical protein